MPSTATDRLDGLTTSVAVKPPCKAVSTSALTLSGEQTIGGVSCVTGDRVLYALAGGSVSNGVWVVSTGAWSRAKDFDGNRDIVQGTLVGVIGDNSALTLYRVTTANPIVIGTTSISFAVSGVNDSANAVFDATESYQAGTVGDKLSKVLYITDEPFGAVGDNVTDDTAAIQAALDEAETRGGGLVVAPWPATQYLIASSIKIPSLVSFEVMGSPTITDLVGIGQAFRYTGADAAIVLKDGELDQVARGFALRNVGVELDAAGATGFRFWRCRDALVENCVVDMDADSQIGFHFKGERAGGTYAGVFDVTVIRTRSYCGASHTNAIHYKLSGTDGDGQCNANSFFGIGAGGSGLFLQVGPSITNSFYGLAMEAPGQANDFIHCLSGATFNDFHNFYCGDAPSGYTGKIFKCDSGATFNTLTTYNAGANVDPEDIDLGVPGDENRAIYGSRKYVPNTSGNAYSVAIEGEAFNRLEIRASSMRFGDGTAAPVRAWPGDTVENTIYSSALGTFTPNILTGRSKFIRFDTGTSGTLTIAAPTNSDANGGDALEFFIFNNTAGSLSLSWNATFIKNTSFPTSIAAGVRISIKVRNVATAWWLVGDLVTM